jgi:hypothetical protein
VNKHNTQQEIVHAEDGTPQYNVYVKQATIHNRSGLFALGTIRFVIPIHHELMKAIGQFGRWDVVLDM